MLHELTLSLTPPQSPTVTVDRRAAREKLSNDEKMTIVLSQLGFLCMELARVVVPPEEQRQQRQRIRPPPPPPETSATNEAKPSPPSSTTKSLFGAAGLFQSLSAGAAELTRNTMEAALRFARATACFCASGLMCIGMGGIPNSGTFSIPISEFRDREFLFHPIPVAHFPSSTHTHFGCCVQLNTVYPFSPIQGVPLPRLTIRLGRRFAFKYTHTNLTRIVDKP